MSARTAPPEHKVRVMQAWPSGRFVACTCAEQSAGSRDEGYLTAWTYQHLGIDPGPLMPTVAALAAGSFEPAPEGALF